MRKLLLVFALLAVPFAFFIGCNLRSNPTVAHTTKAADLTPGAPASNCIIYSDNFSTNTLGNYNYFCTFIQGAGTAATEGYTITGGTLEDTHPGGLAVLNAASFNTAFTSYTVEADFELNTTQNNLGIFGLAFEAGSNHSFYSFQWSFDGSASGGTPDWELEKNNGTPNTGASYLAHALTPAYTLGSTVHLKVIVNGNNFQCYANLNDGAGDRLIFNVTDTNSPYTGGSVGFRTYGIKNPMMVKINNFTVSNCPLLTPTTTPTGPTNTPITSPTPNCGGSLGTPVPICPINYLNWTTLAPMPTARLILGAGVINGILYAVGGYGNGGDVNTLEAYDPTTNTWSTLAPMPTRRDYLAVGVVNGILYAVGGAGTNGYSLQTVEAYNPATNSWSTKAPMPTARIGLSVGVINGILYAVGGNGTGADLNTVEAYDPETNSWSTLAPMPTAREGMTAGVLNGILYVAGGDTPNGPVGTLEAYNPCTNNWITGLPGMSAPHVFGVGGILNGQFYVADGFNGGTAESYDPLTNSWTTQSMDPIVLREDLAGGVINGVLYLVGGDAPNGTTNEGASPVCGFSPTPTTTSTSTPTSTPTPTLTPLPPQSPTATATCIIYSDNFNADTLGNYTYFNGGSTTVTASSTGYGITGGSLWDTGPGGLAALNSGFFNPGYTSYTVEADFEMDSDPFNTAEFGLVFDTGSNGSFFSFEWNNNIQGQGDKGWLLEQNLPFYGTNYLGSAPAPAYPFGSSVHLRVSVNGNNIQCYANLNDGVGERMIFNFTGAGGDYSGGSVGIRTNSISAGNNGEASKVKIDHFTVSSCQIPPPTPTYAPTCVTSLYSDDFSTDTLGNYSFWPLGTSSQRSAAEAGYTITGGSLWNTGPGGIAYLTGNFFNPATTSYTLQADFEQDTGNTALFGLVFGGGSSGFTSFQLNGGTWEIEKNGGYQHFYAFFPAIATTPAYTLGTVAHLKVVVTGNNVHCYVNLNGGAGDQLIFNVTDTAPYPNAAGIRTDRTANSSAIKINNFAVNGCP